MKKQISKVLVGLVIVAICSCKPKTENNELEVKVTGYNEGWYVTFVDPDLNTIGYSPISETLTLYPGDNFQVNVYLDTVTYANLYGPHKMIVMYEGETLFEEQRSDSEPMTYSFTAH